MKLIPEGQSQNDRPEGISQKVSRKRIILNCCEILCLFTREYRPLVKLFFFFLRFNICIDEDHFSYKTVKVS